MFSQLPIVAIMGKKKRKKNDEGGEGGEERRAAGEKDKKNEIDFFSRCADAYFLLWRSVGLRRRVAQADLND